MILVTGGTGFLGSTLIKLLIDQGQAIIAIKRTDSIVPESLKSSSLIEWVDADITDYFALSDIFENITKVYHCAAKISYQKEDAAHMMHINTEGTKHIVNLCLEHQARLVHVSSIAALGINKLGLPVTETDKWEYDKKISGYSLSKYKSELEVWRGVNEGLEAVIINPSVIMGVASGRGGATVLFDIVNKGLKIYPPGTVGVVDVNDVAAIMHILMEDQSIRGERFILNSENISNKDLLTKIAALLHKNAPTIEAKPFMLNIAWRAAKLIATIKGTKPALTEESAHASASKLAYNADKINKTIGYHFKPLQHTLTEIANTYYNK